jgi:phytoene dehydrogenase-like protein
MEPTQMPSPNSDRPADLIVIGGGLAGLATAALVARSGRSVTLLERSNEVGGRAVSHVQGGASFNLGPHALYCRGRASRLLQELAVPFTGGYPKARRGLLLDRVQAHPLPLGIGSLLGSRLFTLREKARLIGALGRLNRLATRRLDDVPLTDWIGQAVGTGRPAAFLRTLFRVSTYGDDPGRMSAGAALDQLKLALAGNVWYLDGGWQTLVNGLRDRAVGHGAGLRRGARAASVRGDAAGVCVRLAGGAELRGRAAVLAVGPKVACDLLGLASDVPLARWTAGRIPVRAACLDVALNGLPRPERCVAFGLDRPLYFSVHSASADLAPAGVAVLHVMKYLGVDTDSTAEAAESELEEFLDRVQPGWRPRVVARRYLPGMIVAHSLPRADEGGLAGRPGVAVPGMPNIFLAGDWVGPEGLLADASAASAAEAARRVLAARLATSADRNRSLCHVAS